MASPSLPSPASGGGIEELARLATGGKAALAAALARLESAPDAEATFALLDAAFAAPRAHVIGLTGPPGVGKSTLLGALIAAWRARGMSLAVIAVDPSSRESGGALLGDRTRLRADADDQGVFVRSMAARDRLGGLASLTVSAMVLMRALYDVVLIETVGVGQSETDVAGAADTVVLCLQPGSGDTLQFMKAGIVEIPHVIVVTKADLGDLAERTRVDVSAALQLVCAAGAATWRVPVLSVAALRREGIETLVDTLEAHRAAFGEAGLREIRARQAAQWLRDGIRERFGREGLRRAGSATLASGRSPFRELGRIASALRGEIFGDRLGQ